MKQAKKNKSKIVELSSGDYLSVRSISPFLIDQIRASVEDPPVPMAKVDMGEGVVEDYPNPNDPEYLRQLADANAERERRSNYALVVHGAVLCDEQGDPVDPPENGWEFRLKMSGINWRKEIEKITGPLEDEEEVKFAKMTAYVLFVGMTIEDTPKIFSAMGVSEEMQQQAAATFRGEEA